MLVKRELQGMAPCVLPKPDLMAQEDLQKAGYFAAAKVENLPQSGEILVVDFYQKDTLELVLRFYSDEKNYWSYLPNAQEDEAWTKGKQDNCLNLGYGDTVISDEATMQIVTDKLKSRQRWSYRHNDVVSEILGFIDGCYYDQAVKKVNRREELMEAHFNLFPAYPDDLPHYCETHVFDQTYIFIGKIEKGRRQGICGCCGQSFQVDKDIKHKTSGICPCCRSKATYFQNRYESAIENKAKLCIANRVEGQLLVRWVNVIRTYQDKKPVYLFSEYYKMLYLYTKGKSIIYAYEFMCVMGYGGYEWHKKKNGSVNHQMAYVYADNLQAVFGKNYYHVDFQKELQKAKWPIDFIGLLNKLADLPHTEYLVKMGLYRLATEINPANLAEGHDFSGILGVSKQYLPLYQAFNVAEHEHRIIKASNTWVSMADFQRFRALKLENVYGQEVENLLQTMSFTKFVNYFTKQKALYPKEGIRRLMTWYCDYMSMNETMGIQATNKSVRYPKDIKMAHDRVLVHYEVIRNEVEDQQFKQALAKLSIVVSGYSDHQFTICLPTGIEDFIKEGTALSHCVGQERYWQNHMTGKRMIFFIRRIEAVDEPFVTMEVDMQRLIILQLFGFGDCRPPEGVSQFARQFVQRLRPFSEAV